MSAISAKKEPGRQPAELKTEGPLNEKDQQGQAAEQQRKLGEIALAEWRRLKEKIKQTLKK
ncbi:hypothetical protein AB6735_14430 [Mucilaginibacter sp. RCC_168]|uniref:hypothetical protein n=1 Tax=Mucilaginibacter sp. RCC_168 TaxID=3239221 RepID=UPI00352567C8